ncbi:hypothetical protein Rumeso_04048 [Rubellimicrobium mesophilum DSM 19309]|uniref:Uncharacterized protein n=1 Tax=Rubellimicrobium mesophilum DSM 19309 TaxID=442562 RepID=A0A017HJL4_9RHOB|nr:hypothetical protein [Rubellimicrobium mesophilum]EYD74363.1 hypothetical protein Rumeso_04048 [Rubellimicrobium mesophilum DSM 19309]
MARPRKDELSKRQRWEIHVTPLERLRIEEGARAMGLPIGAAAAKAMDGVQHVERADWRETVHLLTGLDRKMADILLAVRDREDPLDALGVAAALVSLDRAIRAQAMPWTLWGAEAEESQEDGYGEAAHDPEARGGDAEVAP